MRYSVISFKIKKEVKLKKEKMVSVSREDLLNIRWFTKNAEKIFKKNYPLSKYHTIDETKKRESVLGQLQNILFRLSKMLN